MQEIYVIDYTLYLRLIFFIVENFAVNSILIFWIYINNSIIIYFYNFYFRHSWGLLKLKTFNNITNIGNRNSKVLKN